MREKIEEKLDIDSKNSREEEKKASLQLLIDATNNLDAAEVGHVIITESDRNPEILEEYLKWLETMIRSNKGNLIKRLKYVRALRELSSGVAGYLILAQGNHPSCPSEFYASEKANDLLEEMYSSEDSYFLKQEIDHLTGISTEELPIEEKRKIVLDNWEPIEEDYNIPYWLDGEIIEKYWRDNFDNITKASDEEIKKIFTAYRRRWTVGHKQKDRKELMKEYTDVGLRDKYDYAWQKEKQSSDETVKFLEDSGWKVSKPGEPEAEDALKVMDPIPKECYTFLSNNYGVVYNYSGKPSKFFSLKDGEINYLSLEGILEQDGFDKKPRDEEYEKMLLTYSWLIELPFRNKIENEFGIKLADFSVREQMQFVNFLSSKTVEEVERVKGFLNKAGGEEEKRNRIRSFLSLESGAEMGEKILSIGESLDQESADLIFAKYAEIVGLGDKNIKELSELFRADRGLSQKEIRAIARDSGRKGSDLLVKFAEKIKGLKERERRLGKEEVLKELEQYKADLILTAGVYKSLKESGAGIKLEDFKGVTFEQATAAQINGSKKEVSQMMEIYRRNYEHKPVLQKKLLQGFSEKLKKGGDKVVIYLYKKDGEVIAFNRFDNNGEEGKYFASCNVRPEIAGSSIGGALIGASLQKETANNEAVNADCLPETAISSHYIEKAGFVVKGIVRNYENTGETVFNIERMVNGKTYRYRTYKESEIVAEQEEKFPENKYKKGDKGLVLKFKKNSPELLKTSEDLINNQGYVMTRYFFGKDGSVYCAFEKGVS